MITSDDEQLKKYMENQQRGVANLLSQSHTPGTPTSANAQQVGGSHYKTHGHPDLQHWDIVAIFKLDYFQGNITKYLFRWRAKGGLEDLHKARHYLDKYIELETSKAPATSRKTVDPSAQPPR